MKISRNDNCPCGSKKKYKNCCSGNLSENKNNQLTRILILCGILFFCSLTIYSIFDFYQEDRPEMEAYTCDNPNCGKVHYRAVAAPPTESN